MDTCGRWQARGGSSGGAGASNVKPRGEWKLTTPENLANFSATEYFFGRHLHRELKQPVGLLVSAVGGTPIQNWISPKSQRTHPEMAKAFAGIDATMKTWTPERAKELHARQLENWQKQVDQAKAANKPVPPKPARPVSPCGSATRARRTCAPRNWRSSMSRTPCAVLSTLPKPSF